MRGLWTLAVLVAALPALIGCGAQRGKPLYPEGYVTPMEAPAPPRRRPVAPIGFRPDSQGAPVEGAKSIVAQAAEETQALPPRRAPVASEPVASEPVASEPAASASASVAPRAEPPDEQPVPAGRYRVKTGETLYAVSRNTGLPIRALIEANQLRAPFELKAGDLLIVPAPRLHVVRPGETVFGISRMHGVQMSELVRLNGIKAPYKIPVGSKLVLPNPGESRPGADGVAASSAKLSEPATSGAAEAASAKPQSASLAPGGGAKAGIPQPPPRQGGRFLWPVQGKVIEKFGPQGAGRHNDGINILAPRGEPVRAAENGVVVYAGGQLKGFGQMLLVKHADGWLTAYGHNQDLMVKRGDTVKRGQTLARVGSSGNVAGPQLHFEVRKGKRAVNPIKVLEKRPDQPSG